MDARLDRALYGRLPPSALDEAWLEFYTARDNAEPGPWLAEEVTQTRNRLILHYAPTVKYVVYRVTAQRLGEATSRAFAVALLAVLNGMMRRESGQLTDWTPTCVALAVTACDKHLADYPD